MKNWKRRISALLCGLMILTMTTGTVYAADLADTSDITDATKTGMEDPSDVDEKDVSEQAAVEQDNVISEQVLGKNIRVQEQPVMLSYDDRYSIYKDKDHEEYNDYKIDHVTNLESKSHPVKTGEVQEQESDEVLTQTDDSNVRASGVGTALLVLVPKEENSEAAYDKIYVHVTVEAAPLTIMYLMGQSNMEGMCSANTGYQLNKSVACEIGTVYSTYAPTVWSWSKNISGINFSETCNSENAADFIAGSMNSASSLSGKTLEYPLNTLTSEGEGKTGPDSALAYEWNRLTGEKVWTVNVAWSDTAIASWIPRQSVYERAITLSKLAQKVYEAEIASGHYTEGHRLMYWLQGETADRYRSAFDYYDDFYTMYSDITKQLTIEKCGIIMLRSSVGSKETEDELAMTGPRAAQYGIGGSTSSKLNNVYVVTNDNEAWVSDAGVRQYFSKYNGKFDYPIRDGFSKVPTRITDVHYDIHYSQIGHNENGIMAADGMYQMMQKHGQGDVTVDWRDVNGKSVTQVYVRQNHTATLVGVTTPVYGAKNITYRTTGNISYDPETGTLKGLQKGTGATVSAIAGGKTITLSVTVLDEWDYSAELGTSYTGLYKDNDQWIYVRNGKADFSYTGFVQNEGSWWYIEKGRVSFQKKDVIKGTVNGKEGWWFVKDSQVQFVDSVEKNSNGWWRIANGKVDFNCNSVEKNELGWWYIQNGKVNFGYYGIAKNSNGWWYIRGGKVDFGYNGNVWYHGHNYWVSNGWIRM